MSDSLTNKEELKEKLAAIEHERWSDWQKYVHGLMEHHDDPMREEMVLDAGWYYRWQKQINTPYAELTDKEKASDMEQVDRYWNLIEKFISDTVARAEIEARIGMVEYYDQVPSNKDMDWKGLFRDNLARLKYELAQLKPQQESDGRS